MRGLLAVGRWMGLCAEDGSGSLRCTPALVRAVDDERAELTVPSGTNLDVLTDAPAALVGDEFEKYEDIRGVIVRGAVTYEPERRVATVRMDRVSGFTFGTTEGDR